MRDDPHGHAFLAAHVAVLDFSAGRPADTRPILEKAAEGVVEGGDAVAARLVALARLVVEGHSLEVALGATPELDRLAPRSVELRAFLRCARAEERPSERVTDRDLLERALVVGAAGMWFRAPDGERVGLERRRSLALLLERLAVERVDRPGEALASEILQRAAWPGERIVASAGAHRLRVAVATLRKLGLRDLVETTPTGYRLAADVPCVRG
jgi:hypothetical protein